MSERLAPGSASPLVVALDETLGSRIDIQPTPIAEATRPLEAPESFLPFLGWGRGVDIWRPDWPIELQRARTDRSVEIDRLHGTLAGVKAELDFTAGTLVRAIVPPADFIVSEGYAKDNEAYAAWIRTLPEIRIHEDRSPAPGGGYFSAGTEDEALGPQAFIDGPDDDAPMFWVDGPVGSIERAVIVENGFERSISLLKLPDPRRNRHGDVYLFAWEADAGKGFFFDDSFMDGDDVLGGEPDVQAWVQAALVHPQTNGEIWNLVTPLDRVQDVTPETLPLQGVDPNAFYFDDSYCDGPFFLDGADPTIATYRSLRISDGRTEPFAPGSFFDIDRLGIPAYTAELQIYVPQIAPRGLFFFGDDLESGHIDGAFDKSAVELVREAVKAGMAVRDTVLIDFAVPPNRSLRRTRKFSQLSLR